MTSRLAHALADLEFKIRDAPPPGLDRLQLVAVPFVPEVQLYLAEDSVVWWARMEAEAGKALPAPFWASAWAGGRAMARYVLDHPEVVAGRRVLDLASGSGLVAIAAAKAGAASVTANDIDPYAVAAISMNAKANGVVVTAVLGDLLDGDGGDAEVVLTGDAFYSPVIAGRIRGLLDRMRTRQVRVLIGDPGRDWLPQDWLELVCSYRVPLADAFADSEITQVHVLRPRS